MKRLWYILLVLAVAACSSDDDIIDGGATDSRATVTLLCAVGGMGDNGYNDNAAAGIFAFAEESDTRLRLLQPDDMTEARTMYRQWLSDNAEADSVVLIVGSSAYEQMVAAAPPVLKGKGSRVLLFESEMEISGVSSLMMSRYGASWLAGAMSRDGDAFILAAAPGYAILEESIAGFRDGHATAGDGSHAVELRYLADGEEGFAMPDSAYRVIAARAQMDWEYDEFIFPLLGGSGSGVVSYMNRTLLSQALLVGMDVDQNEQCQYIPFSVVINIGEALRQMLGEWKAGAEWPATRHCGMADGMVDIAVKTEFINFWLWSLYRDELLGSDDFDIFQTLYNTYRDEAMKKEREYATK